MNRTESSCVSPKAITWGEKETATLIALYELEPCLYDRKDPNYSNTIERNNAYHRIQQVMIYILPICTVDQIKNKIRSLCIQFITEKLSKECSIHNGLSTEDTYKPELWCFELLEFLDEHLQILRTKEKSKANEDGKKGSGDNYQYDFLSDFEANEQSNEDDTFSEVEDDLNKMSDEDGRGKVCSGAEKISNTQNSFNKDGTCNEKVKSSLKSINDKDKQGETSSDMDQNSLSAMNKKDVLGEISSYMNDNSLNGMNDKVNNKRKRKLCLVSTPKKISSQMMLDKDGIFGLYVADEMHNLKRKNSLLYLRTKQSILKILTNANFKLANVEL